MVNCSACRKSIKSSEKVTCSRTSCAKLYHLACVNLSLENYRKLQGWVCPLCVSKQPKSGDNSDTPVKLCLSMPADDTVSNVTTRKGTPTPTSPQDSDDIPIAPRPVTTAPAAQAVSANIIREVTEAVTKAMKTQFRALGDRITDLDSSVKYLSGQCDDFLKAYNEIKLTISSLCDENKHLREDLKAVQIRTRALEDALARQEQWSRVQNIEVVGVPENKEESTVGVVLKIAAQAGVHLQSEDVEFAHRVQPRRAASIAGGAGRAIVARFRQRATKDAVVAATRKYRHLTSKDIGMGGEVKKIYVNEHLTKENKQLLKSCKTTASELNFKHVWTKNCRIYMRKTDTSPLIPIICSTDLEKIKQ